MPQAINKWPFLHGHLYQETLKPTIHDRSLKKVVYTAYLQLVPGEGVW
jgi:hypothetical protein